MKLPEISNGLNLLNTCSKELIRSVSVQVLQTVAILLRERHDMSIATCIYGRAHTQTFVTFFYF